MGPKRTRKAPTIVHLLCVVLISVSLICTPAGASTPMANNGAILFHPASGLCVGKTWRKYGVELGSCGSRTSRWSYTAQREIAQKGTYLCIGAEREGEAAVLRVCGTELNGGWEAATYTTNTETKGLSQFSTQLGANNNNNNKNARVCLDGSSPPSLFTRICICTTNTTTNNNNNNCKPGEDPTSQLFQLLAPNS